MAEQPRASFKGVTCGVTTHFIEPRKAPRTQRGGAATKEGKGIWKPGNHENAADGDFIRSAA